MHAAIMQRDFAPPNNPPGRVHTAGGGPASREMYRHVSPRFRLPPHLLVCLFLDLLLQLPLMLLLVVTECTRPRRMTLNPPSATHGEGAHDYTPIAGLQLLLYFPASAGIPPSLRAATPSPSESSDDGGTAALPAAPPVGGHCPPTHSPCVPRSNAGLHLNQLLESKALLQYPHP